MKYATGQAIRLAMITHLVNSFDSIITILEVLAPKTFLIPISLIRCWVRNVESPNNPKQATKIAKPVKIFNIISICCSALYMAL